VGDFEEKPMGKTDEHSFIALVLILTCLLIGGYMDSTDAKLTERASVQVAQK
jgi:hypothetical protein